MGMPK